MYQRKISAIGFFIALAAIMLAWQYFQLHLGLVACDLCMLQRAVIVCFGILMLISFLHNKIAWFYGILGAIISGYGVFAAGKHVLLQVMPESEGVECGPPMEYLYDMGVPPLEIVDSILRGSGSCADIDWSLLGISIPGWTFICFVFLLLLSLWLIFQRKQ